MLIVIYNLALTYQAQRRNTDAAGILEEIGETKDNREKSTRICSQLCIPSPGRINCREDIPMQLRFRRKC